ncbi:hypothetical protein HK097_006332, partial [Rhizophlyctis rosea]
MERQSSLESTQATHETILAALVQSRRQHLELQPVVLKHNANTKVASRVLGHENFLIEDSPVKWPDKVSKWVHDRVRLEEEEQQRRVAQGKKAVVENDIGRFGKAWEVNQFEGQE